MNKRLLGLLFFGVLMGALDIAVLGPSIHAIQKSFNVTSREITWVINAYVITNLISTPLLSKLSDLYGRRLVYISSVALFALGSLAVIFSPVFNLVVAGRAVQGFGSGGFFPVANAVVGDTFPKEKQGTALGVLSAVYGFAFILGPVIGGLLLLLSWRWVFVINIPMAIVLIIGSWKLLPSKEVENKFVFDWAGMLLLVAGLAMFAFSVSHIKTKNFINSLLSLNILPFLLTSFIILPFFIYREKKSNNPIIDTQFFKSKQLIIAFILAFGSGLGETGVLFIPGYIKETFEISYSNASFALLPMLVTLLTGALLTGRMVDAVGAKYVLLAGTAILTIGLIGIWRANEHIHSFYIAEAILGLGLSSVVGAPLRYIVNNEIRDEERASGLGVIIVFTSIGLIVSSSLVGALIASMGGGAAAYKSAFLLLAVVSASMIFISSGLKAKNAK